MMYLCNSRHKLKQFRSDSSRMWREELLHLSARIADYQIVRFLSKPEKPTTSAIFLYWLIRDQGDGLNLPRVGVQRLLLPLCIQGSESNFLGVLTPANKKKQSSTFRCMCYVLALWVRSLRSFVTFMASWAIRLALISSSLAWRAFYVLSPWMGC